ncbi:MAG: transglycosylase domain-containing protein [Clostridia bacterium]|nr:transglycosylase domain-containing protein [Clostridia bacterium]
MKILRRVLLIIILLISFVIGVFTALGYFEYEKALEAEPLDIKVSSIKQKNNYATLNEMPKMYLDAVIAAEDRRFYLHNGVDVISILRAIINDIRFMKLAEGGSTITQQLCKNIYFTQRRELTRKIAEIFMAVTLEKYYSKNDILEMYLNTSYFGDGYYTAKEACMGYFNKELKDMTDYECIMLAGIPNAPSVYAPTKNPELTKQRQRQVAEKMVKYKYLTESQMDQILLEKN